MQALLQELPVAPRTELTGPPGLRTSQGSEGDSSYDERLSPQDDSCDVPRPPLDIDASSLLHERRNPGPAGNVSELWLMQEGLPSPGGQRGGCGLEGLLDPHPTRLQFL